MPELPDPARAELAEVATAAREALSEMQSLLGVLRAGDQPAERTPQPGFTALGVLLSEARAAGADLDWQVNPGVLPEALGLTVFRIVQQALSNASQHAAGAPVRVQIARDNGLLRVQVCNAPGRRPRQRRWAARHAGAGRAARRPDRGWTDR